MGEKYNSDLVKVYMTCANLATEQYEKGLKDPGYDGDLTVLPSYSKLPSSYTMTKAIKSRQIDFSPQSDLTVNVLKNLDFGHGLKTETLETLEDDLAKIKEIPRQEVYNGFILKGTQENGGHIVVFRGTHSIQEWLLDLVAVEIPLPIFWKDELNNINEKPEPSYLEDAKVHLGFLIQYAILARQVHEGVKELDQDTPHHLPVTAIGYSLGGALAILGAIAIRLLNRGLRGGVNMYNIAGPRAGNKAFAGFFNFFIPTAYRVVNMGDLVPMIPPSSVQIKKLDLEYEHVGVESSFLWQQGDVTTNHLNYDEAIEKKIPIITPPMPSGPVNGRPASDVKKAPAPVDSLAGLTFPERLKRLFGFA